MILTGSMADEKRVRDEVPEATSMGSQVLDLMGQLTLRELMSVIGASQAVVSGSTGPAHVAAALGIPTVSLFDPRRNQSPVRWRPLGSGVVLRPDVPTCEMCVYEACPYWDCLNRISVDQVASHVYAVQAHGQPLTILHV